MGQCTGFEMGFEWEAHRSLSDLLLQDPPTDNLEEPANYPVGPHRIERHC